MSKTIPAADSKFQKIARKNHKKWKLRLLSKGKQSAGSSYPNKPSYDRSKSAPPGFGGSLEESNITEVIKKSGKKYCLRSKKSNKNLGCYPTKSGARKRERQVQYFKHLKEAILIELSSILFNEEL